MTDVKYDIITCRIRIEIKNYNFAKHVLKSIVKICFGYSH